MTQYAVYPSLRDRPTFITGGASGIGETLVEEFCAQGARVFFVDIDDAAAEAVVARVRERGHPAPIYRRCDLRDVADLRRAVAEAADAVGPIRALLNNAANDQRHEVETVEVEEWDDRMNVNLRPQFFAAQAVWPGMRDAGGGSIVNFGSLSWIIKADGLPVYVTAKAAVQGLTRGLARHFGKQHVRVNTLMPGWIMTKRQLTLWVDEKAAKWIDESQCLAGRVYPADVARMALWLAADDSAMCSAQTFVVDGGWV